MRPETPMLWQQLLDAGLAQGPQPADAPQPSWYVRLMLGIAGWIGASFLLGFVGIALAFIMRSAPLSGVCGVAACAIAALIYRRQGEHDFFCQFALAISLAGQGLVLVALFKLLDNHSALVALAMALFQAGLFLCLGNFTHRVWAAGAGGLALVMAFLDWRLQAYAPGLLALACAWIWQQEFRLARHGPLLRAGGYGLSLTLLGCAGLSTWTAPAWHWQSAASLSPWAGHAWLGASLSGIALMWTAWHYLKREAIPPDSRSSMTLLAVALLLALANLKISGLAPALLILLLGYGQGNRTLAGLGGAALLGYLAFYYYALEASLLEKSAYLAATGLMLLISRMAARHLVGEATGQKEDRHA